MNRKIEAYLEVLFGDFQKTKEAIELKAELSANLNDRMNDYMAEGKTENQAYSLAIANLGDVDELLAQLPTYTAAPQKKSGKSYDYRNRNAILLAISILLYILSPVPIIALAIVLPGMEDFGVIALLGMVAVATAILIFRNASTPKDCKQPTQEDEKDEPFASPQSNRRYQSISSVVMGLATVLYLVAGACFDLWGSAWVLFPIGGLGLSIYKSVVQLKEEDQ